MNIYVIGPVTGKEDENIDEFMRVRKQLRAAGHDVSIPHENISSVMGWNKAMRISIRNILDLWAFSGATLQEFGIALLDGWEESRGARIEHDLAEALGIECRPWREWL